VRGVVGIRIVAPSFPSSSLFPLSSSSSLLPPPPPSSPPSPPCLSSSFNAPSSSASSSLGGLEVDLDPPSGTSLEWVENKASRACTPSLNPSSSVASSPLLSLLIFSPTSSSFPSFSSPLPTSSTHSSPSPPLPSITTPALKASRVSSPKSRRLRRHSPKRGGRGGRRELMPEEEGGKEEGEATEWGEGDRIAVLTGTRERQGELMEFMLLSLIEEASFSVRNDEVAVLMKFDSDSESAIEGPYR